MEHELKKIDEAFEEVAALAAELKEFKERTRSLVDYAKFKSEVTKPRSVVWNKMIKGCRSNIAQISALTQDLFKKEQEMKKILE